MNFERWRVILVVMLIVLYLGGCGRGETEPGSDRAEDRPSTAVQDAESVESFLQRHWDRPLAPQGTPPAHYSALESSLNPESCAACHQAQAEDWRGSLHAKAMGPGVMGQMRAMPPAARDEHQSCLRCHAPLAEQADSLVAEIGRSHESAKDGAVPLHRQGLVCAACHVRAHERHGPPRRDGSVPQPGEALPHGGWKVSPAFADSRFCAACHQFEPDGFALGGKLLEDTYEEWRGSRYARTGTTCQSCHMPDRRHLWRGIHDPETTRRGVTIDHDPIAMRGGGIETRLRIANTGTGHRFPTYVTPQVVMEAFQVSAGGEALSGTEEVLVIARRVTLDLTQEVFDTRLAPDERAVLEYRNARHPEATRLVLRVRVEPDAFYEAFYRSLLASGHAEGPGTAELRAALAESQRSGYTLYERTLTLPGP